MLTVYKESMRRSMRGKRKFQVPVLKNQIASLAHQTASWYDQVFIQMKRLLEANEENGGEMRWECGKQHSNPFAEKILFVIALYNAHEYIENLNAALKQNNDFCFDEIAQRVVEKSRFQQFKDLRNMNVHHCEYLVGSGDKQACFEGIIQDGTYNIHTNAHWYYGNGETGSIYIGNVEISSILKLFHKNRDEVMEILQDILWNTE